MIDPKSITIIVPHLGGTAEAEYALDECLQSLKETVPDIPILLAINGSRCIAHRKGQADVYVKEQGQGMAVNAAVSVVDTPWIFVTNDDMIYTDEWLDKLISLVNDDICCVSPKLIEPRSGAPTFEVYFCGGAGGDFDKQKWLEFARNYKGNGLRAGFNLPFLIKRDLFNLIGQYDKNFEPWGSNSDSDLQTRIMMAGIQPYQNTDCIVYHFAETSGTSRPENHSYWQKNWNYYIEKYGFERKSSPEIWFSQNIIDYGKLKFKPEWLGKYGTPK